MDVRRAAAPAARAVRREEVKNQWVGAATAVGLQFFEVSCP